MFRTKISDSSAEHSWFIVKGLPPLELNIWKGGYFDGYITHAKDLSNIHLTMDFSNVVSMGIQCSLQEHIPMQTVQQGSLGTLKLLQSWARILVLERIGTSKAKVYLVDSGAIRDVDVSHLYTMSDELKQRPPLAFAVRYSSDGEILPEVMFADSQPMKAVRVAVQMGTSDVNEVFSCSQLTVFDAETHKNIELLDYMTNSMGQSLEKFELTSVTRFARDARGMLNSRLERDNYSITAKPAETPASTNVAVIVVFLLGAVLVMAAAGIGIAWWLKHRERHQQSDASDRKEEKSDAAVEEGNQPRTSPGVAENAKSDNQPGGSADSGPSERGKTEYANEMEQSEVNVPHLPLSLDAIAVSAATLGIGGHMKDLLRRKDQTTWSAPQSPQHQVEVKQVDSVERETTAESTEPRLVGGISAISSINATSSAADAAPSSIVLPIWPIASSTPTQSVYNSSGSRRPYKKMPSAKRSSPAPLSTVSTVATSNGAGAPATTSSEVVSNPKAFCTSASTRINNQQSHNQAFFEDDSDLSDMPEVHQILSKLDKGQNTSIESRNRSRRHLDNTDVICEEVVPDFNETTFYSARGGSPADSSRMFNDRY